MKHMRLAVAVLMMAMLAAVPVMAEEQKADSAPAAAVEAVPAAPAAETAPAAPAAEAAPAAPAETPAPAK